MRRTPLLLLLAVALSASACTTAYYAAMAQLGWAKRDLLANRVQLARDSADQAAIHFSDALHELGGAAGAAGTGAPALQASYSDSAASAARLRQRIASVETAATALFDEWREELAATKDAALRARNQQRYDLFKLHYDRLLDALQRADAATAPVLAAMQARLGAQAAATPPPAPFDPGDGDRLMNDLQLAIALSDLYIAELENSD